MAVAARIRKQIELVQGASEHQKFCSNAASSLEVERLPSHAPRITLIDVFLAIDVWSAGMILLFFLTGKFPLFQSNDDTEALMEIAAIIGKKKMETVAILHGRRLLPLLFGRLIQAQEKRSRPMFPPWETKCHGQNL